MQTSNSPTLIKIGSRGEHLPRKAKKFAATLNTSINLMTAVGVLPDQVNEVEARAAIAELNAAKHAGFDDWRMWTSQEAFAHVDHSRCEPAADTEFYPDMRPRLYRTITPVKGSSGLVWFVLFSDGLVGSNDRSSRCFVRAVRSVSPAGQ